MSTTVSPDAVEQLDQRSVKALTEAMLVCEDHPDAWGDHEVVVYNEDRQYLVNVAIDYCDCPDVQYRQARCKHLRRARFALGVDDVPAWVQRDRLDGPLAERLEGDDA